MMGVQHAERLSLGEYHAICRFRAKAEDDGRRLSEADKDEIWEKVRLH